METSIALKQLRISPLNVRKVNPRTDEDKQLIASIHSQGLLQNLIVIPSDTENEFEVIAGGRRLAALKHLEETGSIDADFPVDCLVRAKTAAIEISLSENLKADMHPADRFTAYKQMADAGNSIEDIAKRFGHTQTEVKKLLKLGDVAPSILDAFRNREITIETVMAFTVCDDQEKQIAVFEDSQGCLDAFSVRRRLLNGHMKNDDALVRFIGQEAYERAGGTLSSDLFEDVQYIDDPDLVESMAQQKMEKVVEELKAEGWAWVETSLRNLYGHPLAFSPSIKPDLVDVPDDLGNQLTALYQRLESLREAETDEDAQEALRDEIESLETEQESYRQFTPEQKAGAGVLVSLDIREAEPVFKMGILPKSEPAGDGVAKESAEAATATAGESQALQRDLEAYQLQALESVLITKPDLCADLAIFTMASTTLGGLGYHAKAVDLALSQTSYQTKDIGETLAATKIDEAKAGLNLSWQAESGPDAQFLAFQKLTAKEKLEIQAYCIATSALTSSNPVMQAVAAQAGFDLSEHWQPTKENYFKRIKRPQLIAILRDLKGDEFADERIDAKKGDLAELLASLDEVKGWLPPSIKAA